MGSGKDAWTALEPLRHGSSWPAIGARPVHGGFSKPIPLASLSNRLKEPSLSNAIESSTCDSFGGDIEDESNTDGFDARFLHNEFTRTRFVFAGNAPKDAGQPTVAYAKALYQFSFYAAKPTAATFRTGSTLTVWFPYVLDQNGRYTLKSQGPQPALAPIRGHLKNNVLSFSLPGVTLSAGRVLYGEIDSHS